MSWNRSLPVSGKDNSTVFRKVVQVIAILLLPLIPLFMVIYKVAFSWWLNALIARKWQEKFAKTIRGRLAFLFEQHEAEFVPNQPTQELPGLYFALATIKVDNLRLRILKKNGYLAVHVAPDFAPNEWSSLETTLYVLGAGEHGGRTTHVGFYDLEKLLQQELTLLESAFRKENYENNKKLIDNIDGSKKTYLDHIFGRSESAPQ